MAHLIQLEVYTGGADIYHDIWVNTDHIVGMLPQLSRGTRIYFTGPALPVSATREAESWIDVRQTPEQIHELEPSAFR